MLTYICSWLVNQFQITSQQMDVATHLLNLQGCPVWSRSIFRLCYFYFWIMGVIILMAIMYSFSYPFPLWKPSLISVRNSNTWKPFKLFVFVHGVLCWLVDICKSIIWIDFNSKQKKGTATVGIGIHSTKAWLLQVVNFKNAIWHFRRMICYKILF